MNHKSKFHQFVSLVVSLGLMLQMILPAASIAAQPLVQTRPEPPAVVETNEETAVSAAVSPNQPLVLSPLTLAKTQSTFQAGGTAVITYTLRNTLSPTLRPDASPTDTITDTVDAISATDFAADPNNVRDAHLTLELTNGQTALQSASLPVDQDGGVFSFNLGDIPPLSSAELVVELTIPSSAANFVELDSGAVANGRWRAIPVTTSASPIRLAPDGFAQWLVCTPDANCADSYVTRKAAELGHDADAIFAFVRGLGYESYEGSLRGARGTLWSEAGNGYDQASLLIALLRASGIPAAYRLGTLNQTDAQMLINSMFPAVNAPSGLVSASAETADPASDPNLLAEAQAHAWAEAYLPGSGWTALDPAFAAAQPGEVFGAAGGGQLAELPDNVRHKVTASLVVEKYSAFPVGSSNLYTIEPLTAVFNTVDLAGEPLVFAHLVESDFQGGLVFASAEHTYTPYFVVGEAETLVEGEAFGELLSNFPFGQDFVVAEWLDFTVTAPDGGSQTFRRELFDDIGYAARTGGGLVGNIQREETARLSLMSSWTTLIAAYDVPEEAINDAYQDMVALSLAGIEAREATADLQDNPNPTPAESALAQETVITYGKIARLAQRMHLLKFAAASDQSHDYIGDAFLVKAYPDSPRLFTVGWERNDLEQTESISFDLLHNKIRAIAYPGQTDIGSEAFLFWRGLLDMAIEHEILQEIAPEPAVSVGAVFNQAIADDIPLERFTLGTLAELAALPISEQAKTRMTTALTANPNLYVLVPAQMVTLAGTAEPTIGWLEIDNETLEVVDTMENGQHMVAVQYAALAKFSQKAGSFIGGFTAAFFSHTMGFWIGFFGQMPLGDQDINAIIASSKQTASEWGKKAEDACIKKSDTKWCKRGVAAGNAIGSAILAKSDPPLQEMLFVLPLDEPVTNEETAVSLTQSATLAGSAVNANTTTGMVAVTGSAHHTWTTAGQNSFAFHSLSVGSADVYQNGSLAASGPVTAVPAPNTTAHAQTDTAGLVLSGSADGTLTLFAPNPTLVGGSQFESYSFNLNAPGSYTLALDGAVVTVNGTTFSGSLEIVSSTPAQLTGSGATAAPNFATNAAFTPDSGGFIAADANGVLSVGGSAVSAANGFALGDVSASGSVTPNGADNVFAFNGSADFFALDLDSSASTMPADSAASFDADIVANFSDSYTLTVHAPPGWDVTATSAGLVTAQPPVGAAAGVYTLVVTAQSETYPDLFAAAAHEVTLTAVHGVSVTVQPDPVFTIPWGPAYDVINFDTAVGRLQIPNAAFTAAIQNTSSSARIFDVDVSGLPFGWTIFGGEAGSDSLQLPLEAGETVQLGLYISPTTSLPPVGNSYPFNVTATALDDGAVTAVSAETFTMPAVAYPAVTVNPANLYAAANSSSAFDVTVTNIGNTSGSFELVSTVPVNDWSLTNLQSSLFLSPGQSDTRSVTVTVSTGDPGVDYPVSIGAAAPTLPYTPTTAVNVYLVSALTQPIYQAASCTLGSAALEAAIVSLAGAAGQLAESCSSGNCNLGQRDAVVAALRSVVAYARTASPLVTQHTALNDIADDLAAHTADADIEADLDALTLAVTDLGAELCEIEQHGVDARFSPYVAAILLGDSASFSLDVTHKGTIATTYAITVSGLPGGDLTFNEAINPGATLNLPITPSPAVLGAFDLTAVVVPVAPDVTLPLTETAVARLNVVDKFVQVTQVLPDPPFVETGTSSATIRAEIANVSGVAQAAAGETAVLAPNGSTLWSNNTPLNLFAGNPRLYELGMVDTSGWDEGVYTVTLNLLDGGGDLIPDGFNYGFLSVGQALTVTQAAQPALVAPGNVTITNIITTSIRVSDIGLEPLSVTESPAAAKSFYLPPPAGFTGDPAMADSLLFGTDPAEWIVDEVEETAVTDPATIHLSLPAVAISETINSEQSTDNSEQTTDNGLPLTANLLSLSIGGVFTRTEQNEAAITYMGVWTNIGTDRASGGSYWRADDPGDTATFSFTGPWLNLGFIGSNFSGRAEVFIDGVSQGVLDLYRREETAVHFIYDGLTNAPHTVSIQVLGSANPYASNDFVQLDYIHVWDGSTLPDGLFEHTDNRVIVSAGWFTTTHAAASGGSYIRDNVGTVWFPFSGDSFTFHTIAQNNNGWLTLYVDGQYLTTLVNYNPDLVAQTYSFEGFGPGPHLLQVSPYGDFISVDAFSTPGGAPFTDPNPPAVGYTRYEEDHRAWLYNGVPFTQTAQSWSRNTLAQGDIASGGQVFGSSTAGNTASITVSGQWVQVGFSGGILGGVAEIFIDGLSQGTVNLYRRENSAVSRIFDGLSNGPHTISVTVISGQVLLDYVDVWDGSPLADGVFETFPNGRFYLSSGWGAVNDVAAVNGRYWRTNGGNAWFPFTGDSVSYRAFATDDLDEARLYLDEQYMGTLDLFSSADISRTFSFEGLGAGVHILRVEQHRGLITLEEFAAPGVAPFYSPPAPSGVTRYEEDDPALLYNGLPYTQTVTTWNRNASLAYHASEGYYAYSSTAGNSVSLSFTGNWFGVGFLTWRVRGIADIYLDGVLLDSVDLFTLSEDTKSVYYDVAPGAHTISVTVNGGKHPNAVGTELALDYIDVWDGAAEADGTFQESDLNRLIYSPGWDLR
ncbi:MAG: transglutaminase domain-containing protein, partial [Chloroflexota bacterium]